MFASHCPDWDLEYQMSNDYDEQIVEYTTEQDNPEGFIQNGKNTNT